MKVLVATATKHGSTTDVGRAIGRILESRGLEVQVLPAEELTTVEDWDAVVLGSAVYVGHWLDAARKFAERNAAQLLKRPVWLFSVGPVGDPPRPLEDPAEVGPLVAATGARDHRLFPGRLDRHELGFGERIVIRAVKAAEGDYRPWAEIEAWASEIADTLTSGAIAHS